MGEPVELGGHVAWNTAVGYWPSAVSGAQRVNVDSVAAASSLALADDRAAETSVAGALFSELVIVSDEGRWWKENATAALAAAAMRTGTASFTDECIVASMCGLRDEP